jgi:(2Fe-2S) ferredoxin
VIYPDGDWYAGLDVADAPQLAEHLISGTRLSAKLSGRPGALDDDSAP